MFVPGKPFILSLMFAGKTRAYLSEVPFISLMVLLNFVMLSVAAQLEGNLGKTNGPTF